MKFKKADFIVNAIQKLKSLPFVEEVDFLNTPDDVEADLSVQLTINGNQSADVIDAVSNVTTDLAWKIFDETGYLPAIHWELISRYVEVF